MAKKRNLQRISSKKRNRPKIRFNVWMLIIIFALSFSGCFVLYMVAANVNDDFLRDEFDNKSITASENSDVINDSQADILNSENNDESTSQLDQSFITNPVPVSAAVDASYFENCCILTDSTLLGIGTHSEFTDVIGNSSLGAASINNVKVESNYGTVTAYETLKIKKPMNVYVMLGSDIGVSSNDDMISNYSTFVTNLKSAIPDTKIYIMQIPPVFADTETVTNELINDYNQKLLSLADSCGVYCIDTNTALKNNNGSLAEEYWSIEASAFTEKAYNDICGFILTHTV